MSMAARVSRRFGSIPRYAVIFRECVRVSLSTALAYRANFIMVMTILFFSNVLFPLVTILIYGSGSGFPGWSFYEVLLIQAIFTITSGIGEVFFVGVFWNTNLAIRDGLFEVSLLKPVNTLFWTVVSSIQPTGVSVVIGGFVLAAVALAHTAPLTVAAFFTACLFFVCGVSVMFSVTCVMSAISFKWVGNSRIPEIFGSILDFAKYPQDVFPAAVRGFTAIVIPVAMIGFFPASALLGRTETRHFLAVIPCAVFTAAAVWFYQRMIHRYEGVGG